MPAKQHINLSCIYHSKDRSSAAVKMMINSKSAGFRSKQWKYPPQEAVEPNDIAWIEVVSLHETLQAFPLWNKHIQLNV